MEELNWNQEQLKMYIENDSELYHQKIEPIQKNLARKKKKKIYNTLGATRMFQHLVTASIKKYIKENPEDKKAWNVKDKLAVARAFEDEFSEEYKLGNYE